MHTMSWIIKGPREIHTALCETSCAYKCELAFFIYTCHFYLHVHLLAYSIHLDQKYSVYERQTLSLKIYSF